MLKRLNKARSRAKDAEEEKRRPKKSESIQKKATLYQEKLFHNLSLVDKDDQMYKIYLINIFLFEN